MRTLFTKLTLVPAIVIAGALIAPLVPAQSEQAQNAPVKPYKIVKVTLPAPMSDPAFTTFRKQLAGVAQKKDRAALGRLVSSNFFWMPGDKDLADKSKSPIENLAKAIGLDGQDALGWSTLAYLSADPSAAPDSQHQGVICSPSPPTYDQKEFDELVKATGTDPEEWFYPVRNGQEVRSGKQQNAPVVEKLGLHVIRVLPEESQGDENVVTIATPSGKTGYVVSFAIRDLVGRLLCYAKEGNSWKIAGYYGGDPGN